MSAGERLATLAGPTAVLGIQPQHTAGQHTPQTVYNLEVQGQHVFRVTSNGLLVHNDCPTRTGYGAFGWGKAPRSGLDSFSKSGASAKLPSGLTRAGHAFEKHAAGQRTTSSKFPKLSGNTAAKNATGQRILDDILTDPGTTRSLVTGGHFKGGTRFTASDGRQAVFDKNGVFWYFGE